MQPNSWLCVECLGTAERVLLTEKRVRPYCAKHRPKDATAFRMTACGAVEEQIIFKSVNVATAPSETLRIGPFAITRPLTEPPKPEPKFKVGQWVRHVAGGLHEVAKCDEDACLVWLDQFKVATLRFVDDGIKFLSLALPRKGERWLSKTCPMHERSPDAEVVIPLEYNGMFHRRWVNARVECGCLVPVVG